MVNYDEFRWWIRSILWYYVGVGLGLGKVIYSTSILRIDFIFFPIKFCIYAYTS